MLSLVLPGPDTMALGAYELTLGTCAYITQKSMESIPVAATPNEGRVGKLTDKCFAFLRQTVLRFIP